MNRAAIAIAVVGVAVGSMTGAGTANAADELYGAIAFSGNEWTYATSVDAASRADAIEEALLWCGWEGASDCEILADWEDGCGALVYSDNAVGTGIGPDRATALAYAYTSLADYYPPAILANVGSVDLSQTGISEVVCTANVR
ncbi:MULTISPECIES: DUF4189 domain-containing protein [Nocardia]|uniref:DUF4189 domain-containing protein n=1 Tax=Nocardia aurea TaxID=2144174 RepID=A0ABV3FYF5_9NOCA|nr:MULTISPECIES: DUF4189 domain-containing protein [Nocardia]